MNKIFLIRIGEVSRMSEMTEMRRLLGHEGSLVMPLSSEDKNTLLRGHAAATDHQSRRQIQIYDKALKGLQEQADLSQREQIGLAVLRNLDSSHRLSPVAAFSNEDMDVNSGNCTILDPPQFVIQSAEQVADVRQFTRANASNKTLEVAAVTGEYLGYQWPPSETFILDFNQSQATIGGAITIPSGLYGSILKVFVKLQVETLVGDFALPEPASALLYTSRGDEDLPLRGAAVGWGRVNLTLHSVQGSITSAIDFVTAWANRDGMGGHDYASDGIIQLSTSLPVLRPGSVSMFVDAICFAGAEKREGKKAGAFTLLECRNKPVGETISYVYIAPARLRVQQVSVLLCGPQIVSS